ncbi:MAG: carbohydrate kinase family protein [Chloroflexi bacterium]|nr:carbohydrate kinase family protein [Chloroflexota bacterium]
MAHLRINVDDYRYRMMIGVGGIGAGRYFALKGNHTLGREESRLGHFLPGRDYCKLHIISHYVKKLLGPHFAALLVGKVGDDEAGRQLLAEMEQTGLDTRYVQVCSDAPTLYSLCFIYPDLTGGNLTTDDSACTRLTPADVARAEHEIAGYAGRGIVLAAPEVPLPAREKLLQLGTAHGFFRAASFVTDEMQPAIDSGLLRMVDLLAINQDEAAVAAGIDVESASPEAVVKAAVEKLSAINPAMRLSITAGRQGSWSWDGKELAHVPSIPVKAVSTGGAGDAHLAGTLAGLVAGLDLPKAQELGTLVAAASVTSPHTIHPEIDGDFLQSFAAGLPISLSAEVRSLLGE